MGSPWLSLLGTTPPAQSPTQSKVAASELLVPAGIVVLVVVVVVVVVGLGSVK